MNEKTIKAKFDELRAAKGGDNDEAAFEAVMALAEGALINLATLAAHVRRKG